MMARKKGKRILEDEMDQDFSFHEGNPHTRRLRKKASFFKIPHWVYRVILILCIAVVGLLLWFNRQNLTPENISEWIQTRTIGMGVGDGFPVEITGSSITSENFVSYDRDLTVVSDTRLTVLNTTAKEVMSRQHSYSSPVLRIGGTRNLIYNLGGTGYQIETLSKTVIKGNAQGNILTGDIASNGRYALVTEEKGYASKLTVYLPDNSEQYVFEFADYYVTDISLNRDGTRAAVTAISAENGGIVSAVYLFNFSNPQEERKILYPETLLLRVFYESDGTIVTIGDNLVSFLKEGNEEKKDYSYQSQQLCDYAVDNGRVVLAFSPYLNSSQGKIVVLDNNGESIFSVENPKNIMSVSLYGDTVAFLSSGTVYSYSINAQTIIAQEDAGTDAKVIALSDESSAYVLGVTEIRKIDLH